MPSLPLCDTIIVRVLQSHHVLFWHGLVGRFLSPLSTCDEKQRSIRIHSFTKSSTSRPSRTNRANPVSTDWNCPLRCFNTARFAAVTVPAWRPLPTTRSPRVKPTAPCTLLSRPGQPTCGMVRAWWPWSGGPSLRSFSSFSPPALWPPPHPPSTFVPHPPKVCSGCDVNVDAGLGGICLIQALYGQIIASLCFQSASKGCTVE